MRLEVVMVEVVRVGVGRLGVVRVGVGGVGPVAFGLCMCVCVCIRGTSISTTHSTDSAIQNHPGGSYRILNWWAGKAVTCASLEYELLGGSGDILPLPENFHIP